jgi:bifunctional DNA-binding transcriptional regulator/antitoxin component of YhaV-PrlF toxin-antitoxin module
MQYANARVGESGRLVIPAEFLEALGMRIGDDVILALAEGEMRIFIRAEAIRRAQEEMHRYVLAERGLADELIAERRAETARE